MKHLLSTALLLGSLVTAPQLSANDAFSKQQLTTASQLREHAMQSPLAYEILTSLTTEVGPRLPGTENDKLAVAWAERTFKELGFDKVWLEPASFPAWRRYHESGSITSPSLQPLKVTALGNSISTPEAGLQGDIVLFETLDELMAADAKDVQGKIVFINYKMNRHIDGNGYGPAVRARRNGASEASKKGAIGYMMRSVSTSHHRFAHTGASGYQEGVTPIVNLAIANQDADQIARLVGLGQTVSVNLNVQTEDLGQGKSFNVIGEITGTTYPDEYVLIGGHLDSWDLGTGALDDGAGVALTMAAGKYILDTKRPKRSIRVVLFAAEELGLWGAKDYAKAHQAELNKIVAAAESDFGADVVYGFESNVDAKSLPTVRAIAKALSPLNIDYIGKNQAGGGPDLIPLKASGVVPVFDLHQDGTDYFDYHHTADDTLDKVDPAKLQQNTAAYAVFAFLAADAEHRIQAKEKK